MTPVISSVFMWIIFVLDTSAQDTKEYCLGETFNASCNAGQVIVITHARYGRMKKGKCIEGEGGRLGCFSDVLSKLDEKCAARQSCTVGVTEFAALKPCHKDFSSYLEVSHKCLTVPRTSSSSCRSNGGISLVADGHVMYRFSTITTPSFKTPGRADCPWNINVKEGQKVNLTAFVFNQGPSCSSALVVKERNERTDISLCRGDSASRERRLYVSQSNHVTVYVSGTASFILSYKAIGCADPRRPTNGWIQRNDDVLTVKCNNSEETWYLTCAEGQWNGDFDGNCSGGQLISRSGEVTDTPYTPYAILLAVLMGVVLGVLIGAVMLLMVHWYRRRNKCRNKRAKFIMVPQEPNDKTPDEFTINTVINDGRHGDPYPALVTDNEMYGTKRSVRPQDHCFSLNNGGSLTYKQYHSNNAHCPMYHHVDGKVYECPTANSCVKCDTTSSRYTAIDTDFDN